MLNTTERQIEASKLAAIEAEYTRAVKQMSYYVVGSVVAGLIATATLPTTPIFNVYMLPAGLSVAGFMIVALKGLDHLKTKYNL